MANRVDANQILQRWIWVYTISKDLSVPILRIVMITCAFALSHQNLHYSLHIYRLLWTAVLLWDCVDASVSFHGLHMPSIINSFSYQAHTDTPQPLYITIIGVQGINHVIQLCYIQTKCIDYIEKWPFMVIFLYNLYIFLSIFEPCCIQNRVITNCVIKRLMCILVTWRISSDFIQRETLCIWPHSYLRLDCFDHLYKSHT